MIKTLVTIATASILAGCAAGEHTRAISAIFGDDGTAPPLMTNQHIIGYVYEDEAHFEKSLGIPKTTFYVSGIRKDANNFSFRYAAISSPRLEEGKVLWKDKSSQLYITGAMIPDQIGRLKAWDIVELRSIKPWDVLVDFRKTGEGQIVTRVLCRKSEPGWEACRDALPRFNKHPASGHTGRPFPSSVKDYPEKFTFSEFYGPKGELLRPLP